MSTNVEIEIKSKLTKQDYNKLVNAFLKQKPYTQINYYFDTKDREISKRNCGLRIRDKNGKFELTLKIPNTEGKLEINQQISDKVAKSMLKNKSFEDGEIKTCLESFLGIKTSTISNLGKLTTERIDLRYKTGLISIDKSTYNGITEYEIEIEDDSEANAEKHLKEFLSEFGIEYKKSPDTKLKRFLDSLD